MVNRSGQFVQCTFNDREFCDIVIDSNLDMDEMLDEWGREFFAESRRRIDLIRFGKFSSASWWDKTPDAGNYTEIFPIMRPILNANKALKQNPGYNE